MSAKSSSWFSWLKPGKKEDAFIFTPDATNMTCRFEEELRTKMSKRGLRLISSEQVPDDDKTPLVLICNNISRIGEYIESTLKMSSCEKFDIVYLLVLHACDANHVLISKTKDRFWKDTCLKNYSSILLKVIDIAYTPENGIYSCDMNDQALKQLESIKNDGKAEDRKPDASNSLISRGFNNPVAILEFSVTRSVRPDTIIPNVYIVGKISVDDFRYNACKTKLAFFDKKEESLPKHEAGSSGDNELNPLPGLPDKKEEPWRKLEGVSRWDNETKDKLLGKIQETEWKTADMETIEHINIMLIGPAKAGKSSFINSIASIDDGRIKQVTKLNIFKPSRKLAKFNLYYTMGTHDVMDLQTEDIIYMVKGNVLPGYTFNPKRPIDETHGKFKKDAKLKDKMHCVAFMIHADEVGMQNIPKKVLDKIKEIQRRLETIDVQTIVILTNVDKLSQAVADDITKLHECTKVGNAVKLASEMFSVQEHNVFPVKNFTKEMELESEKEIPLLLALRQMLNFSVDVIENKLQNENP